MKNMVLTKSQTPHKRVTVPQTGQVLETGVFVFRATTVTGRVLLTTVGGRDVLVFKLKNTHTHRERNGGSRVWLGEGYLLG